MEAQKGTPVAADIKTNFDVLIAEDNPVNQKLAVKFLERYGHSVEIAENGHLAVEAYKARAEQNRRYDAILVRRPASVLKGEGDVGADIGVWRRADGRVDAVHGRYGGDGAHPDVRADARSRADTHYRAHRARKYVPL